MNLYATLEPVLVAVVVVACLAYTLRAPIARLLGRKPAAGCSSCDHCSNCGPATPRGDIPLQMHTPSRDASE